MFKISSLFINNFTSRNILKSCQTKITGLEIMIKENIYSQNQASEKDVNNNVVNNDNELNNVLLLKSNKVKASFKESIELKIEDKRRY